MNWRDWLNWEGIAALLTEVHVENNVWIAQIFIVVFITGLLVLLLRYFLLFVQHQFEKTENEWDDAFIEALHSPALWFFWLIGLTIGLQIVGVVSEAEWAENIYAIRKVGVILLISWFLMRFSRLAEEHLQSTEYRDVPMDETSAAAVGRLLRVSVMITTALVALQTFGFSISGVLAFGGMGGIAVGFAAKDLLSNFFGGLMIFLDKPFKVGDWVRSPDRNIEGTVENIGWRTTCIRTFDKRPLYVPNSIFATIAVENPSRMKNRRIHEVLGIRYADIDKMEFIVNDVRAMLENHEEIDTKQTLIVNFDQFAASSVDFFVYTFTKTVNWEHFHRVKQDVLLKIADIIENHGAECAFPSSMVYIADENSEK